jgi:hypothetical protein
VVQKVLSGIDDKSLRVSIVWTAALRNDTYEESIRSRELVTDPRVRHYWDGANAVGTLASPVLGTKMQMAWDVYFAYGRGAKWEEKPGPPNPANWLHQKISEDPKRRMDEASLGAMLRDVLK